jgi:formylglycine-generating enzyme required for sulfatase activity
VDEAKAEAWEEASGSHVLAAGAELVPYRVVRALGMGAWGEVYEVEHVALSRRYALRLLPEGFGARAGEAERFWRAVREMADLEHACVVRVDDSGEAGGRYWLRMELAGVETGNLKLETGGGGRTVASVQELAAARGGRVDQGELAGILGQVLEGLAYAHGRGVAHGNLKASNVLLAAGEGGGPMRAKIADFGLSGLMGARPRGARDDLHAAGEMAFGLLTGRRVGLKRPSEIDGRLAGEWDEFLSKALEEERDGGWAGAREMLAGLAAVVAGVGRRQRLAASEGEGGGGGASRNLVDEILRREAEERRLEEAEPAPEGAAEELAGAERDPSSRQEKRWAWAAGVALALAVGAGAWALNRGEGERAPPPGVRVEAMDLGGDTMLEVAWIPPGGFVMGSPAGEVDRSAAEGPLREVRIARGFWMGRTEVTQGQFERVMGYNPSAFAESGPEAPVESVTWHEAKEFCAAVEARLGEEWAGWTVRLPSEAEWEYACRAGTTTPFHYGESLDSTMANFDGNHPYGNGRKGENRQKTVPVASFGQNAWGLYDLHGNVWEWCEDWWNEDYEGAPGEGSPWRSGDGDARVLRGGSWFGGAGFCRSANRLRLLSGDAYENYGFRVALTRRL